MKIFLTIARLKTQKKYTFNLNIVKRSKDHKDEDIMLEVHYGTRT